MKAILRGAIIAASLSQHLLGDGLVEQPLVMRATGMTCSQIRFEDPKPLIEILGRNPEGLYTISRLGEGQREFIRYIDNKATLASMIPTIEVFTMASLNRGRMAPEILDGTNFSIERVEELIELFEDEDLFSLASEEARIAAVTDIADAYIKDPQKREVVVGAAKIPIRWMRHEDFDYDDMGFMPYQYELATLSAGMPQSYHHTKALRSFALDVSRTMEKSFTRRDLVPSKSERGKPIPITIVGGGWVKRMSVSCDKLQSIARRIIPPRRFMTGNRYPMPGYSDYSYLRTLSHTYPAVSLQKLAKVLIEEHDNTPQVQEFILELVAYNGYTASLSSQDKEDTYLLLPNSLRPAKLYLAAKELVGSDGNLKGELNPMEGVFGVKEINIILQ